MSLTTIAMALTVIVGALAFTDFPQPLGILSAAIDSDKVDHSACDHDVDEHAGHDHGEDGQAELESVELSDQARANLRLKTQIVSVGRFSEYIEVLASIADWTGLP